MVLENKKVIDELIEKANNQLSWREREDAIKCLKPYHSKRTERIIVKLALHDPVFKVKNAAFLVAQSWDVNINGKPIRLTKKKKGNLVKDIHKKLVRVRDELKEDFTIEEFKEKFKEIYPKVYDIYDGDKGTKLDRWLKTCINTLPKKKEKSS